MLGVELSEERYAIGLKGLRSLCEWYPQLFTCSEASDSSSIVITTNTQPKRTFELRKQNLFLATDALQCDVLIIQTGIVVYRSPTL